MSEEKGRKGSGNVPAPLIAGLFTLLTALLTAYVSLIVAGKTPNPFEVNMTSTPKPTSTSTVNLEAIAGTWEGTVIAAGGGAQGTVQIFLSAACIPGQVCGTYFSAGVCKGELRLSKVDGLVYTFIEHRLEGPPQGCQEGGTQQLTPITANELSLTYHNEQLGWTASGVLYRK